MLWPGSTGCGQGDGDHGPIVGIVVVGMDEADGVSQVGAARDLHACELRCSPNRPWDCWSPRSWPPDSRMKLLFSFWKALR